LRKELAWLRRGPPARTSKPQFRIDAANALIADEPPARDGVELVRLAAARLGKTVIDAFDVSARVGDRVLLDDVTWQLGPGDRIGILGPNGSGKTTFLRVLAGDLGGVEGGVEGRPAGHPVADRTPRPGDPPDGPAPDPGATAEVEGPLAVSGRVVRGKTVRLGYLGQGGEGLDPGLSAREVVASVRGNLEAWEGAGSVGTLLDSLGLR